MQGEMATYDPRTLDCIWVAVAHVHKRGVLRRMTARRVQQMLDAPYASCFHMTSRRQSSSDR
jgi:hypothetical protein